MWRNRQTRTVEGRVGNRMGSSPISRTKEIKGEIVFDKKRSYLFYFLYADIVILLHNVPEFDSKTAKNPLDRLK